MTTPPADLIDLLTAHVYQPAFGGSCKCGHAETTHKVPAPWTVSGFQTIEYRALTGEQHRAHLAAVISEWHAALLVKARAEQDARIAELKAELDAWMKLLSDEELERLRDVLAEHLSAAPDDEGTNDD